uniref:40S ribosomal protein S10 n=1 Tax=Pleurostomum flabellatum TaxID=405751 RepID=A0A7T0M449_9EUKA|nr:40S ribosomal protein S10 [Pleurostomum flabellatum]QPL15613.1 40S ribosomal protein S10 [Pleurostomum flabellatum]
MKKYFFFANQIVRLNFLILFFFKRFFIGRKKNKYILYFPLNSNLTNNLRTTQRKIYFFEKYLFFFLLKKHIKVFRFIYMFFFDYFRVKKNGQKRPFSDYLPYLKNQSFFLFHQFKSGFEPRCFNSIKFPSSFIYFQYQFLFIRFLFLRFKLIDRSNFFHIPFRKKIFTVLKSPHKYKKSREQFGFFFRKVGLKKDNFFDFFQEFFDFENRYDNSKKKIRYCIFV